MENVTQRYILRIVIFVIFAALLSSSAVFTAHSNPHPIRINTNLLNNGDIIFRRGTDSVSKAVLAGDESAHYSHVGLIVKQHEKIFVLHAIPAETKAERDEVKIEPLSIFITPDRAIDIGVFRLRESTHTNEALKLVTAYAISSIGHPFDFSFDSQNDKHLYCTELVWKAYQVAGVQIVDPTRLISFPLLKSLIITPSAISKNSNLVQVNIVSN